MSPEQGHVLGCWLSGSPGSDMSHRHLREHPGDPGRQDLLQAVRPHLHLHRVTGRGRPLARSSRPPSLCSLRGGGQLDLWKVRPPSPPHCVALCCHFIARYLCFIWLCVDVWTCTSSILHLVIISMDRYIAVTHPVTYPNIMTGKRFYFLFFIKYRIMETYQESTSTKIKAF